MDCAAHGFVNGVCAGSICFGSSVECRTLQDCVAIGPEYQGGRCEASRCLPNPRWRCSPTPTQTSTGRRKLEIPILDAITLESLQGVPVVACQRPDLVCAQPVARATSAANGHVVLDLPADFGGYFQVASFQDYLPALYFSPTRVPDSGVLEALALFKGGVVIDALATSAGASGIDPTRGHLTLIAEDCMGLPLAGVSFSSEQMDSKTLQFYLVNQLPTTTAKETVSTGQAGYFNFPVGTALLQLTMKETGLALTTAGIAVRAGFMSVAYISPESR
jgi:hypothetical protein